MMGEFDGLAAFVTVADTLSFRRAAEQLGVTHSAVSQAVRRLEARLGVTLLSRTTRSVRLTEAGTTLVDAARSSLDGLRVALAAARDTADEPHGRLRLAVSSVAERFLDGKLLSAFLAAHPNVRLDLTVTDAEFDIVAHGYDAGVRLGEIIEQDMVAVAVSDEQRQLAVASPAYLAKAGSPEHPRDLTKHRCIGWRRDPDVAPYRWEFTDATREFAVSIDPLVATNDMGAMVRLACMGVGITIGLEETFRPFLDRGDLTPVLETFCPSFPGFFLYYPNRREMSPTLRALVDHLRRTRRKSI